MKRNITLAIFAICSVLLSLGASNAAERPFKGRIEGTFLTAPTAVPWIVRSAANASGNATHIGAFTKVTSDVIDLSTLEAIGAFTMTTANGDLLTGVYSGYFFFGAQPGTFSWVLDATITGGTGRFARASGAFVFLANVEFGGGDGVYAGKYSETFDGKIDY